MVDHNRVYQERFEKEERAALALLKRIGSKVTLLDKWVHEATHDDIFIVGINIKVRFGTIGDVLVVMKGDTPQGAVVAFHSAGTVAEALTGVVDRIENGSLKWKEDTPYGDNKD